MPRVIRDRSQRFTAAQFLLSRPTTSRYRLLSVLEGLPQHGPQIAPPKGAAIPTRIPTRCVARPLRTSSYRFHLFRIRLNGY